MAEPTQIVFSYKEVVECLVRKQDIHEGIWGLSVKFAISAANVGPTKEELRPAAIYGMTMRDWVLFSPFMNSVRRKSKNPRESGRPELRSKARRKTKTSAFKVSLSCS